MKNGTPGTVTRVSKFVCTFCQNDNCDLCIDKPRARANLEGICECRKHTPAPSA